VRHFEAAYLDAFREYIDEPCEITLRNAYELGRDAVERGLSVLDVAVAHHDALARVLGSESAGNDDERIVRAAGDFFLESVSSFEMVHRGFQEARDAASLELRHAEMLRQLSHFLADASLAIDGSNSLDEILRLVAEHARELVLLARRHRQRAGGPATSGLVPRDRPALGGVREMGGSG
jgi:hypothetical protein